MFADDNVTSIQDISVDGFAVPNTLIDVFAQRVIGNVPGPAQLVGQTSVGANGEWEVTLNTFSDGAFDIFAVAEDSSGNRSANSPSLRVLIDTLAPNTPLLDLLTTSDTGISSTDEITSDNTPSVLMTTTDPNAANLAELSLTDKSEVPHLRSFRRKTRRYLSLIRPPTQPPMLQIPWAICSPLSTLCSERSTLLADGTHNLKLEVEDRAGNISEDFLLEVVN